MLNLPYLTDTEYAQAEALAGGIPLDRCSTCEGKGRFRLDGATYICDCETQITLRKHYLLAGIGDQYQRLNWQEDFQGPIEIRETVDDYLKKWASFRNQGIGLFFTGGVGTAKTMGATHVAKEVVKKGERVLFVSFHQLLGTYRRENHEDEQRKFKYATLLVIDEVQAPTTGPQFAFFKWELEALIRHRTDFNLPTIITTNLNEKEFSKAYEHGYSLLDPKMLAIETSGNDFRKSGTLTTRNLERAGNMERPPIT